MSGPDDPEQEPAPEPPPKLTTKQKDLLVEHEGWRKRVTRILIRRFSRWLSEDEITDIVLFETVAAAVRWDDTRGVPFAAFAMLVVSRRVCDKATRRRAQLSRAYKVCGSASELWLSDPKIIQKSDEDRRAEVQRLANEAVSAMVVASSFSLDVAGGDEEGLLTPLMHDRIQEAIQSMSARKREILERRYSEPEETLESISKSMDLGFITVRRAHAEALAELRALFG